MATFTQGDYTYTTLAIPNVVGLEATDKTKVSYGEIPSSVTYGGVTYTVYSVVDGFRDCTNLRNAPVLPDTIESMETAFRGCTNLTSAPSIPPKVDYLANCFRDCVSLEFAPEFPTGTYNLNRTFYGCSKLITAPVIPKSVTDMRYCFKNCTKLAGDVYIYNDIPYDSTLLLYQGAFEDTVQPIVLHPMNDNVDFCERLAKTATNNNVYVNVHPQEPTTFTDTEMNYKTENDFIVVSPQTHSDVVQCEVPDLVNGGTVTTNVNDVLVDLAERIGSTVEYVFWKQFGGLTYTRKDNEVIITGKPQSSSTPICKYTALSDATYKIVIDTNIPSMVARCFYQVGDTGELISYSPNATVSLRKRDTLTLYIYWSNSSTSMTNFTFKPKLVKL